MLDVPLASRGLQLFPSVPGKGGLYIGGWSVAEANGGTVLDTFFTQLALPARVNAPTRSEEYL